MWAEQRRSWRWRCCSSASEAGGAAAAESAAESPAESGGSATVDPLNDKTQRMGEEEGKVGEGAAQVQAEDGSTTIAAGAAAGAAMAAAASTSDMKAEEGEEEAAAAAMAAEATPLPSGEMVFRKLKGWALFLARLKMLFAPPWQRVKKGSALCMKISGEVTEQLGFRFSPTLSVPQLCENLRKAAVDPRISGVCLKIEPLSCGWGKLEELRRHIQFFVKSGKYCIAYMPVGGEKEYYLASACQEIYAPPSAYLSLRGFSVAGSFLGGVLEKVGVEPQVERIGKYKSAGDQIARKDMSLENREMLTALLEDIYSSWLDTVAASRGKTREDVETLLQSGTFETEKLKEGGWLTDLKYEDEIEEMLRERTGVTKKDKPPRIVEYRKYSRVKEWTLGLRGSDRIAVIRAVGAISRDGGSTSSGITNEAFIEKLRFVRDNKAFKAVVLRIDSPGGDALASDLMWRELRLLSQEKPVIASMSDVAASGGYYMAMGTNVIVAEKLTLTGSIGVVSAKINLGNLYKKIGFNKEVISRGGPFAELDADQRSFRPEEAEYFSRFARYSYDSFRNKAALSRNMEAEKIEDVAQGRVWTGLAASTRGLVDALGGINTAIAIAKEKAGIAQDKNVTLVELSRQEPTLAAILSSAATVIGWPVEICTLHKLSKFLIVLASALDEVSLPSAIGVPQAAATSTLPRAVEWMAPDGIPSGNVRLAADSLAGGWEGSLLPQSLIRQLGGDDN